MLKDLCLDEAAMQVGTTIMLSGPVHPHSQVSAGVLYELV